VAAAKDVPPEDGLGLRGDLLPGPSILVVESQALRSLYSPFSAVI